MKLRDKILYMSFGARLVVLGMVLNSFISGNVNAQVDMEDAVFENITCRNAVFETVDCKDAVFETLDFRNALIENIECENALIETVDCKDAIFGNIVITDDVACRNLAILDVDEGEAKALLGLDTNGNGRLVMYGDDSNYPIAYLGENEKTNEMILQLQSKSKIDKRQVMMMIGKNGGRFDSLNKIGESINSLEVDSDSGGSLDVRVKYENKKYEQSKSIR